MVAQDKSSVLESLSNFTFKRKNKDDDVRMRKFQGQVVLQIWMILSNKKFVFQ